LTLQSNQKTLLVRADFVLARRQDPDRRAYKRWRNILFDALPRLLGCERRCRRAEKVRLRSVGGEMRFSGWLRIAVQRRPGRKRIRKFKERLRARLESSLLLIDGQVVKVGVRRCWVPPARPAAPEVAAPLVTTCSA
jgi:hypothetical protein